MKHHNILLAIAFAGIISSSSHFVLAAEPPEIIIDIESVEELPQTVTAEVNTDGLASSFFIKTVRSFWKRTVFQEHIIPPMRLPAASTFRSTQRNSFIKQ